MFVSYLFTQPVAEISWQKSIDVCKVVKGTIVATAEHPVTLTSATSNVTDICEKLSQEAFGGVSVRLVISKNLPIHDMNEQRASVTGIRL